MQRDEYPAQRAPTGEEQWQCHEILAPFSSTSFIVIHKKEINWVFSFQKATLRIKKRVLCNPKSVSIHIAILYSLTNNYWHSASTLDLLSRELRQYFFTTGTANFVLFECALIAFPQWGILWELNRPLWRIKAAVWNSTSLKEKKQKSYRALLDSGIF